MVEINNSYEVYKDSGVEWLGEIPEHWEVVPGFSFIFENKEKNTGMKRNTVLSLSYGNIRVKGDNELTGLVPESFETYQFVNKGDLIFRPTDLQNDTVSLRSSISEFEGIITNAYLNLRFKSKASPKFFHYFFRAIDNNKIIYGLGSGLRQNISYLDFRRFRFPFPPLKEQTAIANFLDDKTAKIEQAIAIKEQQITLLKERKQIIIQEAVTKGLDKTVKMKDSGVEWIGTIPEHWEVKRLKYILKSQGRIGFKGYTTSDLVDEGHGALALGATHMNWDGSIILDEPVFISWKKYYESPEIMVRKDNILIVQRGSTCGKVALVDKDFGPTTINPSLVLLKEIRENSDFVFLGIKVVLSGILNIVSNTAIPMLSQFQINNIQIAIPTTNEQITIVNYVKKQSNKFDQAISIKEQEIEKLKEYKVSLIDAVVTGKVKVC
ncbi:restriction endonuclease subunit S [Flavobacterium rakeshii]|uniref:Restriction endonuclease subunit S n=1 Tax=Flavobacterium rakeshii TaxID=1038845 RepID=A0A6N8HGX2_9FLAO|nr:restriction endonuclease subunit S [Flavobacterium rakeshii]MUV04995.1 restriction endonuclease subunit S [Flavobacterium rakeshii]